MMRSSRLPIPLQRSVGRCKTQGYELNSPRSRNCHENKCIPNRISAGMKKSGTADAFRRFRLFVIRIFAGNKQMKVLFVSPSPPIKE